MLAYTSRDFAAVVAEGANGNPPQAKQFIEISNDLMARLGVHPNFLYQEEGRTIFVGIAWISRSQKCYPDWPAPDREHRNPRDYCVEEPISNDDRSQSSLWPAEKVPHC